jgi:hypothetical protein
MDVRKTAWVCWKKVLASHRDGGLGVNNIFALNHALLFKRIWRFLVYPNALWVNVVKAIHGEGGGIDAMVRKVYPSSVWINVLKPMDSIKDHGIDLLACCNRRIGDGCSTRFWSDKWVENGILKDIFPSVYALELDMSITVATKKAQGTGIDSLRRHPRGGVESTQWSQIQTLITDIQLTSMEDRWCWTLEGRGQFSVKSARVAVDKKILIANGDPARWSKFRPKKVNIMVWKMMDRISTRVNLDARGIDIPSVLCPICEGCSETVNYLFFECSFVTQVYNKFSRWWDIHIPGLSSYVQ